MNTSLRWIFTYIFLNAICQSVNAQDANETKEAVAPPTEVTSPVPAEKPTADKPAEEKPADSATAEILAGHSYHGEAFNEGPRQKAYLMGGTGNVSFPATTKNETAQQLINQGVGQLHGFWYLEAERSFRQAAAFDPECAIAYWGAALTNRDNEKRAKGFIAEAVKHKDKASERERMYIDALKAYIDAGSSKRKERAEKYTNTLEDIVAKYPDDLEAKAFLTLQLYQNKSAGIPLSSHFAVDALIKQIIEVEPLHPAHHFRIHLWDSRKPEIALTSASACGQGSPKIAHMWHMPGHIYSKVKRYDDAAWQQEASARVDYFHMMHDRLLPDQIHNFAHNNEWLIRDLVFIGRVNDAISLAKNMAELPRHPKYNTLAKRGSTYYGRLRLFEVLGKFELWNETIALCHSTYLEPTNDENEQIKRLRQLGAAYFNVGDNDNGKAQLAELDARLTKEKAASEKAGADAEKKATDEKKKPAEITKAKTDATKTFTAKIRNLEKAVEELKGWDTFANGDKKEGVALLQKAGIDQLLLARARFDAGEKDAAITAVQSQVKSAVNQVLPGAYLVDLLWRAEKKEEAAKAFEGLRKISSSADIDSPVFVRLAPVAESLGLPADWRLEKKTPTDVGERPSLDSLGPFCWEPSPASDWTLKDADGNTHSSKEFQGKPHVVIFYLGYGCLHCAEQLKAFGPAMKDFEAAGISMLAISSDEQDSLKNSIDNYEGGPMPIPLLSNAELDVFKSYRVFDDFENQPLHGTFVIDGNGLVLWQDISHEPFMDHKFLLEEAQRLLSQRCSK